MNFCIAANFVRSFFVLILTRNNGSELKNECMGKIIPLMGLECDCTLFYRLPSLHYQLSGDCIAEHLQTGFRRIHRKFLQF
jgi:hypothetical protein